MRKHRIKVLLTVLIATWLLSGCAGWKINGIPVDKFKRAAAGDRWAMVGGGVTSFAVHWLGHVIYLESNDYEWHMDSVVEFVDEEIKGSDRAAFGRAGFVAQLAGGVALNLLWPDSYFTDGYDLVSLFEVASHPVIYPDGDVALIDDGGGNAGLEWGLYTATSIALLLR